MKFPFYKQLDGMDCGPSCLRMIARYHGKKFSVQQLREQSFIQRTGVNMQGISEAATSIGMRATGIRTTIDKLKQQSRLPCILHWNQIHFVVLYNIVQKKGKTYFYIADPAYGLLKYEEEELKKCWISTSQGGIEKGIAMLLEVTPQFYDTTPIKYEGISLWHLLRYVHPYRKMIVQLIIGLLAGSVLQLAFPFLTQTIVDQGIGHRNLNFIQLILAAQLMLVFSRTLIEVIRRCILLHISTRVNVALISDFLVKLMRLPMRFFDSKLAGDLIRRIEDHKRIEMFLTQSVLSILFATITIIIFGGVLAVYNLKIFLLFLLFSILYVGWVKLFMRKRADLNRKSFEQMSVNQDNLMQMIYGMQDIKLLGCEQQKRWEWENIQASLFHINIKSLNLGQWQQVGAVLINEVKKYTYYRALRHRRTEWRHHIGYHVIHTVHHWSDARPDRTVRILHAASAGRPTQSGTVGRDTQQAQRGGRQGTGQRRTNIRQPVHTTARCVLHVWFGKVEEDYQRGITGHSGRKDYRHRRAKWKRKNNVDKTDAGFLSTHGRKGVHRRAVAARPELQAMAQALRGRHAGRIYLQRHHSQQHRSRR